MPLLELNLHPYLLCGRLWRSRLKTGHGAGFQPFFVRSILTWGNAPGMKQPKSQGLKARSMAGFETASGEPSAQDELILALYVMLRPLIWMSLMTPIPAFQDR